MTRCVRRITSEAPHIVPSVSSDQMCQTHYIWGCTHCTICLKWPDVSDTLHLRLHTLYHLFQVTRCVRRITSEAPHIVPSVSSDQMCQTYYIWGSTHCTICLKPRLEDRKNSSHENQTRIFCLPARHATDLKPLDYLALLWNSCAHSYYIRWSLMAHGTASLLVAIIIIIMS